MKTYCAHHRTTHAAHATAHPMKVPPPPRPSLLLQDLAAFFALVCVVAVVLVLERCDAAARLRDLGRPNLDGYSSPVPSDTKTAK